jgi:hypothetical protein
MKSRSIAITVLVLGVLGGASALHAQPKVVAALPADPPSAGAAPGALEGASRAARYTAAARTAGLSQQSPVNVNAAVRLTPNAPRHPSGADVVWAGYVFYQAAGADGEWDMTPMPTRDSVVRMSFPVEAQKIYVLDCKLVPGYSTPVVKPKFVRNGASQGVPVEGNHALYAFSTAAGATSVRVDLLIDGSHHHVGFYGCELTKTN